MPNQRTTHDEQTAQETLVPYVPTEVELDGCPPFPFPTIGSLLPDGWEQSGQSWVVATGMDGDPLAMTGEQFKRSLRGYIRRHPGHGFAVIQDDDSLAVVSAFRRLKV